MNISGMSFVYDHLTAIQWLIAVIVSIALVLCVVRCISTLRFKRDKPLLYWCRQLDETTVGSEKAHKAEQTLLGLAGWFDDYLYIFQNVVRPSFRVKILEKMLAQVSRLDVLQLVKLYNCLDRRDGNTQNLTRVFVEICRRAIGRAEWLSVYKEVGYKGRSCELCVMAVEKIRLSSPTFEDWKEISRTNCEPGSDLLREVAVDSMTRLSTSIEEKVYMVRTSSVSVDREAEDLRKLHEEAKTFADCEMIIQEFYTLSRPHPVIFFQKMIGLITCFQDAETLYWKLVHWKWEAPVVAFESDLVDKLHEYAKSCEELAVVAEVMPPADPRLKEVQIRIVEQAETWKDLLSAFRSVPPSHPLSKRILEKMGEYCNGNGVLAPV